MRRSTVELYNLRQVSRTAESVDDLKHILDFVLDHLESVENDYQSQRSSKRRWWLGRG
jgi:hypothetical protein